jgi:MscS family membrane protein
MELLPHPLSRLLTRGSALLALLVVLATGLPSQAAPQPSCRSPQQAARSLLDWLQPERWDPAAATTCLDLPAELRADAPEIAVQLKKVLDAKGLYVPVESMSMDPDYADESGAHRATPLPHFPELVISRQGDRWLWSRDLVGQVPQLYSQTFSGIPGKIQHRIPAWAEGPVLGISTWQIIYAGLLFLVALAAAFVAQKLVADQFLRIAKRTGISLDGRVVRATRGPITWFTAGSVALFGLPDLQLSVQAARAMVFLASAVTSLSLVLMAARVVDVVANYFGRRADKTDSRLDDQVIPLTSRAVKTGIWVVGIVFVVQNLGIDVGGLMAGLGIGGLAFALAAKDTVENLFGSLTIFTDRPFQIGDWVVIDGKVEGVVEEVGFRSTRIRTFHNSLISVPNAKVANSTVDNLGERAVRRVKTTLGFTYDASRDQLESFMRQARALLEGCDEVWDGTLEVQFTGFGASSLDVMLYFFLDVPDWSAELDTKSRLLLDLMGIAEDEGLSFAFPSTSVYVESLPAGASPPVS